MRYHGWWPGPNDPFYVYNPSENGARINYYGQNAVPNLHIDGIIDAGSDEFQWWSAIQSRKSVDSPIEITIDGEFSEITGEGLLAIDITATGDFNNINIRVRIALTESDIFFEAPNGVQWHNQVLRDAIPYPYGIPIDIEFGETVSMNQSFVCPEPLEWRNSNLVVWVQSDFTSEVLQAAAVKLDQLSPTRIEDESSELPFESSLSQNYPNPFNAGTSIRYELSRAQDVVISVYDITGRLVSTPVDEWQNSGAYAVDFTGTELASGIYFYRMKTEDIDITRSMTLLK